MRFVHCRACYLAVSAGYVLVRIGWGRWFVIAHHAIGRGGSVGGTWRGRTWRRSWGQC